MVRLEMGRKEKVLLSNHLVLNANSSHIPLADSSVDMTFTSPPFKDDDISEDYFSAYSSWMSEIFRVTKKVAIVFNSSTKLKFVLDHWPADRVMVWSKGFSLMSFRWSPIFVYGIPPYKVGKYIWCDAFGIQSIKNKWKVHQYQDPLFLYQTIIKMFKDCKTVLDPFVGSGTTGQACKLLKLDFIGFDILQEHSLLSKDRISKVQVPMLWIK